MGFKVVITALALSVGGCESISVKPVKNDVQYLQCGWGFSAAVRAYEALLAPDFEFTPDDKEDAKPEPTGEIPVAIPGQTAAPPGTSCAGAIQQQPLTMSQPKTPAPAVVVPALQAYYFKSENCGFCQQFEAETYAWMRSGGWRIGTSNTDHVIEVYGDRNPAMARQFGVTAYPTYVFTKNGTVIATIVGKMDRNKFVNRLVGLE